MKYLITGGCGFLGSNIAAELLVKSHSLILFDNLSREGSQLNLEWLQSIGEFRFVNGDIRDALGVERLIKEEKPDVTFHLAGQVAMTTSIENPRLDFEVNAGGSFNLLNAIRLHSPQTVVLYSSTNKVYGDLEQFSYQEEEKRYNCVEMPNGFDESVRLDFHSPYGTSKGSADQYMLDFARIYGLKTVVFRHSSMFGGRQFATHDQGWVGWFVQQALETKSGRLKTPFTISGNGKQVRDLLYSKDCVALYLAAADNIERLKGQAFNIGGGLNNSCSLLELFDFLQEEIGVDLSYEKLPPRSSDQRWFVADIEGIQKELDWAPKNSKEYGLSQMIAWAESQRA